MGTNVATVDVQISETKAETKTRSETDFSELKGNNMETGTKFLNTFQNQHLAQTVNGGNKSGKQKNRFCFRQKLEHKRFRGVIAETK